MNYVLELMTQYVVWYAGAAENLSWILLIVLSCVLIPVQILALFFQIRWINKNKATVFKSLTALPKGAVCAMADRLRSGKNGETETDSSIHQEVNKQEDNVLKIFTSVSSSSLIDFGDGAWLITATGCQIIFFLVAMILLRQEVSLRHGAILSRAAAIDGVQGGYTFLLGGFVILDVLVLNSTNNPLPTDYSLLHGLYTTFISSSRAGFIKLRYKNDDNGAVPMELIHEVEDRVNDDLICRETITASQFNPLSCWPVSETIDLIDAALAWRIELWNNGRNNGISVNDTVWRNLWVWLIYPVYDQYITPLFDLIIVDLSNRLQDIGSSKGPVIIVLVVLAVLVEIPVLFRSMAINSNIRSVLELVLHCPVSVVLQTHRVVCVIDGDFSGEDDLNESGVHSEAFFQDVVDQLPDGIFVIDNDGRIDSVNKAGLRVFGVEKEAMIHQHWEEFFNERTFGKEIKNILKASPDAQTTQAICQMSSDQHMELSRVPHTDHTIIVARDITRSILYNQLVSEERERSDKYLGMILPPGLVPRVQAGEKNISFAVQSVSIIFMDIVSFTPWCGSMKADQVMIVLNYLFRILDEKLSKFPTMTQVKFIGDCYMAAGGIFSEMNTPIEHARETVSFGLAAIDGIQETNNVFSQSLEMRIGVHTGGPVVAGVLGTGKPTFEVLGPAINMAHEMESHGVAMNVHVSRACYELIYGGQFAIKERGEMEVKGTTIVTYLVSRRPEDVGKG
jgi:PAS domain S-box-containing protein